MERALFPYPDPTAPDQPFERTLVIVQDLDLGAMASLPNLPHLGRWGLGNLVELAATPPCPRPGAAWGLIKTIGNGNGSGYFELMGLADGGTARRPEPADPSSNHGGPRGRTVLDQLVRQGRGVLGVGSILERFGSQAVPESVAFLDAKDGIARIQEALEHFGDGLILVDLAGTARAPGLKSRVEALQAFDAALPAIKSKTLPGDLVIVTAVPNGHPAPLFAWAQTLRPTPLGTRSTGADVGATVAEALGVSLPALGTSFLSELK